MLIMAVMCIVAVHVAESVSPLHKIGSPVDHRALRTVHIVSREILLPGVWVHHVIKCNTVDSPAATSHVSVRICRVTT